MAMAVTFEVEGEKMNRRSHYLQHHHSSAVLYNLRQLWEVFSVRVIMKIWRKPTAQGQTYSIRLNSEDLFWLLHYTWVFNISFFNCISCNNLRKKEKPNKRSCIISHICLRTVTWRFIAVENAKGNISFFDGNVKGIKNNLLHFTLREYFSINCHTESKVKQFLIMPLVLDSSKIINLF